MKTRIHSLILTIALLLSAFTGCGKSEKTANNRAENSTPHDEIEPDYSWFSFPEDTDKLVIYTAGAEFSSVMDPAIRRFNELYPDIEVSYQVYGEDEYKTMLRAEIPAGKGPDLVLLLSNTFPDIYKTMSTDIFVDLNPFFALDEEIDLSEFVGAVMDGGVMNGKRYIVPICYDMPLLLTTQSILDEVGMSEREIATYDGFCEAAARFKETYPDADLYIDLCGGFTPEVVNIRTMYNNLGFNLIDYSAGELKIDETRFRQYMDTVKLYYDPDYDIKDTSKEQTEGYYQGGGLMRRMCLFDNFTTSKYGMIKISSSYLAGFEEKAVLLAQSNQNDGVTAGLNLSAAIPQGSANKANAWKLLKILLSDEIQGGHDPEMPSSSYFWAGFPVRLSSVPSYLNVDDDYMEESESLQRYVSLMQSPTEAVLIPNVYRQYIADEMLPYIRGEKTWEDCWNSFLNTMELYKDE